MNSTPAMSTASVVTSVSRVRRSSFGSSWNVAAMSRSPASFATTVSPARSDSSLNPGPLTVTSSGAVLLLGGPDDAGAVLVGLLVGTDLPRPLVVDLAEHGLHLGHGQLVVSGPRLVAAQRRDALRDRGAVLVAALVGVALREVDLREPRQPARDLVG